MLNFVLFPFVIILSLLIVVMALVTQLFSKATEIIAYVLSLILLNTRSESLFKATQILVALGGMTATKPKEHEVDDE